MKTVQRKVYEIVRDDFDGEAALKNRSLANKVFNIFVIIIIVITVLFIILDSFELPRWYDLLFLRFELFSIAVFTIEYLLRLWTAPLAYPKKKPARARIRYAFTFMALIDFFSVAPYFLSLFFPYSFSFLRTLRAIRLFQLIKVNRYTRALDTIATVIKKTASELFSSMFTIFVLMIIASVVIYEIEGRAQPDVFPNALSGLWWAVTTLTTVGYGDIYPITILGKILSAVVAILGIALVAVPTGIISSGFVEVLDQKRSAGQTLQPELSIPDEIAKYKKLLDEGALTQEEYDEVKKRLLSA